MKSDSNACREYNVLSRRAFLRGSAIAGAAIAMPAWLPRVALAKSWDSDRDVIVSIYLRGGTDGLTMCVPYGEGRHYYDPRPTISVAPPDSGEERRCIDLDGFFGFPPAFAPLVEAYRAGHLLVVHGTGSDDGTRSHFDAQYYMEVGKPGDLSLRTGWLGRHLQVMPPAKGDSPLRGLGISHGLQRTLSGAPKTLAIPDPSDFGFGGNPDSQDERKVWTFGAYRRTLEPVRTHALDSERVIDLLDLIDFENYVPGGGAVYPNSEFGMGLKAAAALIKADVGLEAVQIDLGGWDTHSMQGSVYGGMAENMEDFASSVGAFHKDIASRNGSYPGVTLVAVSEFGRNVAENESYGTDHGHGNCLFVLGESVNGGRVLADWPGLHPDQLYEEQDLKVTIDFRDILAEVVAKRLGNRDLHYVFPQYRPTFRGVCR